MIGLVVQHPISHFDFCYLVLCGPNSNVATFDFSLVGYFSVVSLFFKILPRE